MELLLLAFVVFAVVALVGRAARRRAERQAEQQAEVERAVERGDVDPAAASPFGLFPFGGIFEELLKAQGMTRSYTIDPETGEWVEISDELPEPLPEPEDASSIEPQTTSAAERRAQAKRQRRSTRSASSKSMNPFGMLGGMGGDGSGDFDVQRRTS